MTDLSRPNHDPAKLNPAFREKLFRAIAEANRECAKYAGFKEWGIFEGFRSQERQSWLYGQGRTGVPYARPGQIVTAMKTPKFHGKGLAADLIWKDTHGKTRWDGEDALWETLAHCMRAEGLSPSALPGDKGHFQLG